MARKKSAKSAEDKTAKQKKEAAQQTETTETETIETASAPASGETVSKEEYDKLKAEFDAQKNQFLRMAAEYDNFRKRTEKEKLSTFDNALATTVEAFLPVADNFALALASGVSSGEDFRKGIEMIEKQLDNAFEKLNVVKFGERGEDFNPLLHDAISRVDDEELEEDKIVSVYQKGYKIGDKIIRHATVQVAN